MPRKGPAPKRPLDVDPVYGSQVVTSMPLDSRTRATFRSAEFGFFGVVV